jgi:RNA polymerase sigma factor (sigma-70 family)
VSWVSRTHWSLLLSPRSDSNPEETWEYFYTRYRGSVRALFSFKGAPSERLDDLVQEFFLQAFKGGLLAKADPERGRFRGYLRTAATRFLASEWRREGRQRRRPSGGWVELEAGAQIPAGGLTPEQAFDLSWAQGVLGRAVERTREELSKLGLEHQLNALLLRQEGLSWSEVAERLDTTSPSARAWSARAEKALGKQLCQEVRPTVGAGDLDEELRELSAILAR